MMFFSPKQSQLTTIFQATGQRILEEVENPNLRFWSDVTQVKMAYNDPYTWMEKHRVS